MKMDHYMKWNVNSVLQMQITKYKFIFFKLLLFIHEFAILTLQQIFFNGLR